ncbi:DNA polymerase [Jatrophihabitans endophyticus]|uniref:Type-4 uracil-DNA glycosylase n=1 Tax=Jatrophihabitans endophyticus TaxID=1206085 RepID=A0A1M5DY22_9ACTN|nr:UdgX family uracil-DNA binding protein [Jatrophihabitans endophyticus]SHF71928.1 DNA polymerase [Jatrophihabitans endophyticus]
MAARPSFPGAAEFVPDSRAVDDLRTHAAGCRGCDLYADATQTVFGSGNAHARVMLVGEQPGDVEDTRGYPFVGPAGQVLRRGLTDAGLGDTPVFVTNAVKHFRFTERGRRRIHEKPTAAHATACRPWLAAELRAVRPAIVVALGATAAGSLFGSGFRLTAARGQRLDWPPAKGDFADSDVDVQVAFATVHPSSILRTPDDERDAAYAAFVADLAVVAEAVRR